MAGKPGRSGRPRGSESWYRNPTALAGHHLNVLIEHWLAVQPERRFTVPPKQKRFLAERAIEHVINNAIDDPAVLAINVDDVLGWSRRRTLGITLRRKARRS